MCLFIQEISFILLIRHHVHYQLLNLSLDKNRKVWTLNEEPRGRRLIPKFGVREEGVWDFRWGTKKETDVEKSFI